MSPSNYRLYRRQRDPSAEDAPSDDYLSVNCCGCQHLGDYPTGSSRPSGRRDFHLLYVTEGVCFLRNSEDGEETAVPAGSVILYLPAEPQFYRFRAGIRSTSYFIHFSGTGCTDLLRRAGMLGGRVFTVGESTTLTSLFGKLIDDFNLAAPLSEDLCAGYLAQFIALVGRSISYGSGPLSVRQNARIEEICRRMHRDYRSDRPIAEYAAACSLSESRFSHLFKESTGVSPHRYLLNVRIAKACELLEDTDLPIAQICAEIGISDQNYFSRAFKKSRGCSPTEHRKAQ